MSKMYVARRANGDLFAAEIDGRLQIPIWASLEEAARYRERNPELMTFLPARLSRPLMKKIQSGLGREGTKDFLLISDYAPDAYLNNGRPISLEEIFPDGETASPPA